MLREEQHAKKLKEIIQKDKLTIADLEGAGLKKLKQHYKNDVELEYHVDQFKETVIPYIITGTEKGVVYLNKYNRRSLMKLNEVHKFCDGTLIKIQENMIKMITKNKLGRGNERLKGRDWNDKDIKKSNEMVNKIDQVIKHREQLRHLEEYVGGRPKTINPSDLIKIWESDDVTYDIKNEEKWDVWRKCSMSSKLIAKGDVCLEGCVGVGGGEVNGGGVDLGVVKSCVGENPDGAIGEVGGDSRGVEGDAD
ncbi:hypothetical protein Tco_0934812 [Tanacetum coccineum]